MKWLAAPVLAVPAWFAGFIIGTLIITTLGGQ